MRTPKNPNCGASLSGLYLNRLSFEVCFPLAIGCFEVDAQLSWLTTNRSDAIFVCTASVFEGTELAFAKKREPVHDGRFAVAILSEDHRNLLFRVKIYGGFSSCPAKSDQNKLFKLCFWHGLPFQWLPT